MDRNKEEACVTGFEEGIGTPSVGRGGNSEEQIKRRKKRGTQKANFSARWGKKRGRRR